MNPNQGTELRSGRVIHSSSGTSSPIDPDMAQSSANDSDNNETSDISSQLSEKRENYEKKINELQSEFSQLKNLLMAVISKNDEKNLPSASQSSSKPTHRVGFDKLACLTMVILSRSCHDLAMILASVPCIMISHDLGKGTMVNHDLARLTMIMASVPWLRTLGNIFVVWLGRFAPFAK